MKKRFFSLLLVLTMVLSLLPVSTFAADIVDSGSCGDNLTWTLDSDGVLTISGNGAMADYEHFGVHSPWYDSDSVQSVIIKNGVTSVGRDSFDTCTNLTSVIIPDSVTSIGEEAFFQCINLPSITIPDSVKSIGDYAFYKCSKLVNIVIPDGVTYIWRDTFSGCSSLTSITIPDSVINIESDAFNYCSSLTYIEVGPNNRKYLSINGVLFDQQIKKLIRFPEGKQERLYTIPDGVISIEEYAFFGCSNLTSIKIPDSVTSIEECAFFGCSNLTSIKIPDSVISVKGYAFCRCSSLSSITLPDSVISIEEGIFKECHSLISVSLPVSATKIEKGAFYGCDSLTSITLPNSVTEIGFMAFVYCHNLTSITIPDSMASIDGEAFRYCSSLTDVFYSGSIAQWNEISVKSGNSPLLNATIHFNSTGPGGQTDPEDPTDPVEMPLLKPLKREKVPFQYYATHLKDHDKLISTDLAQYSFAYDEAWFEANSSVYQHDLARASLCMSMAGMGWKNTNDTFNYANIRALFKELNFSNLSFSYPKPEANTIGYAIGSKNIQGSDGEPYTLISVVVRSSGYFEEWGGNVTLGPNGNHKGFQTAADKVLNGFNGKEGVLDYIAQLQKSGELKQNVKIWITGYSRGAATANLAAAELNEKLGKENVYAYCFECPQGTVDSNAGSSKYNNIFCLINPIDLVPKVAMSKWDFTRYGQTYYYPARANMSAYPQLKDKMIEEYKRILFQNGTANLKEGVEKVTKELQVKGLLEQGALFDKFVNTIACNMGSRSFYYQQFEGKFAPAVANLVGVSSASAKDYDAVFQLVICELLNIINNAAAVGDLPSNYIMLGVEVSTLAVYMRYAHYPELSLAWLNALDGETMCSKKTGYRTIIVNCPVDISVFDSNHTLAAKFVDDTPQIIENGVAAYVDENGQKVVILPMDMEYTIDIQATGDGTMTYTAVDYDMDSGSYTQVVSYQDVPIQTGDQLRGTAPQTDQEAADYTLKNADNQTLQPTEQATGKDVSVWNVTASAQEGGTVSGGGVFVVGEYARVTAEPKFGYRFLGWFEGEKKVSEDAEYRFAVEKDTDLTARFERTSLLNNPFTDVKESAYYFEPVLWAVNHVPQITNGTGDKTFSPEWECLRCQIVTFLWRAMGCPEPTSTVNPFVDVKPTDYFYKAVLWAVEQEITNGMDATHFGPNLTCTRGQAVTFLWRAEGKPTPKTQVSEFTDVQKVNEYYYIPVLWAVENGITNGTGDGKFSPEMICLREQIVTFLYRDLK